MRKFGFIILSLLVVTPVQTSAVPLDTDYKKVKKVTSLKLKNCNLFDGVTNISIGSDGQTVALPNKLKRQTYRLDRKYRFFACGTNELSQVALYAKKTKTSTPSSFVLTNDNFPEATGPSCQSWPGSHIYKTVGSHHFTDIRRNTIGLILKIGASGPFPSCVEALDSNGNVVAKLGLYARGAGWAARYYAGIGCGSSTPLNGSGVANKAKKNTGNSNIYMDFGSKCYGPIEANRCIGSSQC
ncbi:MAG: hypothetical protein J5J00_03515 [Deltaproteobacteria bacterium]|nr:hypothetical protein [Deltaproteobacteria bacterium]